MKHVYKESRKGSKITFIEAIYIGVVAFLTWVGISHLPKWELAAVVCLLVIGVGISAWHDLHKGTVIGIASAFVGLLVVILYYEPWVHEAIENARAMNELGTSLPAQTATAPRWDDSIKRSIHSLALYLPLIGALSGAFISLCEVMDLRAKSKK
jgi:hypothetical protein